MEQRQYDFINNCLKLGGGGGGNSITSALGNFLPLHTHVCFCELGGLSIDFYYFYTDQIIFSIPKPTPYRKAICIVTLSDKHHLQFFPPRKERRPVPTMSKNFRFYSTCGDIWSPQCSIKYTHTHTHTHTYINITEST